MKGTSVRVVGWLISFWTVESDGAKGLPQFHVVFYPSLDDIVKIGMLYQNPGRYGEEQISYYAVIAPIFTTERAVIKDLDHSLEKESAS